MIEHNGKQYARVSEILKPFTDFSHIDPKVVDNKARIGTNVHTAIAEEIAGDFPAVGDDERGYFLSYLTWVARLSPVFLESETRYYDDDKMITGQIDALITFKDREGLPILVDFKTSANESPKTWPMQAHLYEWLLTSSGKFVAPQYLFVKLAKNGGMPSVYHYKYDKNIFNLCMQAVSSFWSENQK